MATSFRQILATVSSLADKESDSEETKLQHRFLVYMALLMCGGGIVWGGICAYNRLFLQSLIPFSYILMSAANLIYLQISKDFPRSRFFQVLISLLLPFMFQWSLGGFVSTGCVMLWSFTALVGSFTLQSVRQSVFWLISFLVLTVISGLVEGRVAAIGLNVGPGTRAVFFVVNIGMVTAIISGI